MRTGILGIVAIATVVAISAFAVAWATMGHGFDRRQITTCRTRSWRYCRRIRWIERSSRKQAKRPR